MRTLVLLTAAALALTAVRPPLSIAQKRSEDRPTRSVQGVVNDGTENAVQGAVVQLKDTKTLQIRSFITKEDGAYHFHGLSPDIDYELKAEHQGASSSSRTLSSFDGRKIAVINLKVEGRK